MLPRLRSRVSNGVPMRATIAFSLIAVGVSWTGAAHAKPVAPAAFCSEYPTSPACSGADVDCTWCHTTAPIHNAFGADLAAELAPGVPRPLSDQDFVFYLPDALHAVEDLDSDGDSYTNLEEFLAGTGPGDAASYPGAVDCNNPNNPSYNICGYDYAYVYRKVSLDFCGYSPRYDELNAFRALDDGAKATALDALLDSCIDSEFWVAKNGQLWQLAHAKIRPVGALKSGEDQGQIPLADYYDDYAMFTWSQIDGHDARDVLTANYYVQRAVDGNGTTYFTTTNLGSQVMDQPHRVGMLTTFWNLQYNTMFTALPRATAAQAYRAFLGYDIAKQQGLNPVLNEPVDYDQSGVTNPQCAVCHSTLDPLCYPFRNYHGIGGGQSRGVYVPQRLEVAFPNHPAQPLLGTTPESGYIFGQPVSSLPEWAQVAANSDAFAQATARDYWRLTMGHEPTTLELDEFTQLWQDFMTTHDYSVEAMLHDLIHTEAYGVP